MAEGLDGKIETVAEGVMNLGERLARLDEKVDRKFEEVTHQFSETRAMIKFSYAELDQRLRSVEGELSDLRQRVDRLESSSTH